jgi:membrane associated rhomboid family serine protease
VVQVVIHFLVLVLVVLGAALYFMTREERVRAFEALLVALRHVRDAITLQGMACDEFFEALRARTRRVLVTPSLIALSVVITLFSWSGNFGPGEWRGLVTTGFVHARVLDLFVNAACLLQIGLILERLVGRLAFATVYIAAGLVAGIVTFSGSADAVRVGASASVLAIYGLLLVTSIWSAYRRSSLMIPLTVAKRLAPVAAVFVFYNVLAVGLGNPAALAALAAGLIGGIVVARDVNERTPPIRPLAIGMTTAVAVVMIYGVIALHGAAKPTTDVRPEIERVIAVEYRTTIIYDKAVDRFRKGRMNATALADVIEHTVMPELHAVAARLDALKDVPPEHQSFVATAETFLKLRDESWQLRAAALLKGDIMALRQADKKEQASLEAFHRVKTPSL